MFTSPHSSRDPNHNQSNKGLSRFPYKCCPREPLQRKTITDSKIPADQRMLFPTYDIILEVLRNKLRMRVMMICVPILKSWPIDDASVSIEMTVFISSSIVMTDRSLSLPYIRLCSMWNGYNWYDGVVWWTSYIEDSGNTTHQFVIVITIHKYTLQQ